MKYFSILFFLGITGCVQYAQIIQVSPVKPVTNNDNYLVYENDSIKVAYVFWEKWGRMTFRIENKLNVPIYIDWKRSSFIAKGLSEPYYSDRTTTHINSSIHSTQTSTSDSYRYYNETLSSSLSTMVASFFGSMSIEREQPISFVPPHAYIIKITSFRITPGQHFNIVKENNETVVTPDKQKYKVWTVEVGTKNPNVYFDNFLAFSTDENFSKKFYIDNKFYISKVITFNEIYLHYYTNPTYYFIDNLSGTDLGLTKE
jgi:hypothetical protein